MADNANQDELSKLIKVDLVNDIKRIKEGKFTPEQLQVEVASTVLLYIKKLGEHSIKIRDWSANFLFGLNSNIESLESRVDEIGAASEGYTQINAEDADKFIKFIEGARWIINEVIPSQPDIGKKKLQELIELSNECETIIKESLILDPEDMEEEDGDEEDEEDESEETKEEPKQ